MISLRELNLTNNSIRNLPYEIGKLFRLQSLGNKRFILFNNHCVSLLALLGLMGNPLPAEIFTLYTESNGLQKLLTYFLDSLPSSLHGRNYFSFLIYFNQQIAMNVFSLHIHIFLSRNRFLSFFLSLSLSSPSCVLSM